jgi:MFS family permease
MTVTTPAPAVDERLDPALIRLAAVLLVGGIAAFLDTTIVNVALADIGRSLHAPVSSVQWVLTGYLLSFAMVIPLSGWALQRFGGRATWVTALAVFLAGSVACGAAPNIGSLIAFRVVQGIGGGMMVPLLLTLLVQAAGGRRLGRLMSTVSLPVVIVPILGPVVGGLIVSNLSWRWIFYVNVPICLVGLVLAWRGLRSFGRPGRGAPRPRLDVVGLALLSPGVAAILYGLAQVSSHGGFGSPAAFGPAAAGAAAVALFVVRALRLRRGAGNVSAADTGPGADSAGADPAGADSAGADPAGAAGRAGAGARRGRVVAPIIDLGLFRSRSFTGSAALMFLFGLSLYGALLLLPLYYQEVRGASALAAGLLLAPQGVGTLLPRLVVGRLTDRLGPRPVVIAGTIVAALGTLPFALAGAHTSEVLLSAALVVRGAGLGAATIAVMAGAYEGLRPDEVPDASSATRIMQQVGGAFGASVLAVILQRLATAHAAAGQAGLASAFGGAFWWCLGFTAVSLAPALLLSGRLRRRPDSEQADTERPDSEQADTERPDSEQADTRSAAAGPAAGEPAAAARPTAAESAAAGPTADEHSRSTEARQMR